VTARDVGNDHEERSANFNHLKFGTSDTSMVTRE
jgi:hypothetical protein